MREREEEEGDAHAPRAGSGSSLFSTAERSERDASSISSGDAPRSASAIVASSVAGFIRRHSL